MATCNHGQDYDAGRLDQRIKAANRIYGVAESACPSCGQTSQGAYLRGRADEAKGASTGKRNQNLIIIGGIALLLMVIIAITNEKSRLESVAGAGATVTTPAPAAAAPTPAPPPVVEKPIAPAELRQQLAGEFLSRVELANSHLNFIEKKLTKMKGGYGLWLVHDMFTQSSFSYGDNGKLVQAWVGANHGDLKKAGIVRVGFRNSSGYLGYCYFDVD